MSMSALAIGEAPVAAQTGPGTTIKKPPPNRTLVASADRLAQPEPR